MHDAYIRQTRLLMSILPDVAKEESFALKGGTGINFFYRDMPRLSVDIDLTYLPVRDRAESLQDIEVTFDRIAAAITERDPRIRAQRATGGRGGLARIRVIQDCTQIKVETSPVFRGVVHSPARMRTQREATRYFGFAEINVVAFEDIYAGKLNAALARQHPRDLFDVKFLYENEGLTDELFRTFMVYVAGSNRPMHELLAPNAHFLEEAYNREFSGMALETVTKDDLIEA